MSSNAHARPGRPWIWVVFLPTDNCRRWVKTRTGTRWLWTSCCDDQAAADLHRGLDDGCCLTYTLDRPPPRNWGDVTERSIRELTTSAIMEGTGGPWTSNGPGYKNC